MSAQTKSRMTLPVVFAAIVGSVMMKPLPAAGQITYVAGWPDHPFTVRHVEVGEWMAPNGPTLITGNGTYEFGLYHDSYSLPPTAFEPGMAMTYSTFQETVIGPHGFGGGGQAFVGRYGGASAQNWGTQTISEMNVTFSTTAPLPYFLSQDDATVTLSFQGGGLVDQAVGSEHEVSGMIGPGDYVLNAIAWPRIDTGFSPVNAIFAKWFVAIPAPGPAALAGAAGLMLLRRRRSGNGIPGAAGPVERGANEGRCVKRSPIAPAAIALACAVCAPASGGIVNWYASFQMWADGFSGGYADGDYVYIYGTQNQTPITLTAVGSLSLPGPNGDEGGGAWAQATFSTSSEGLLDMTAELRASGFNGGGGAARVWVDVYFDIENIPHPNYFPYRVEEVVSGLSPYSGSYTSGLGPGSYHFVWDYSLTSLSTPGASGTVSMSFEVPSPGAAWVVGPMLLLWRRRR